MVKDYFGDLEEDVVVEEIVPESYVGYQFGYWTVLRRIRAGLYECSCLCGRKANKHIGQLKILKSSQCFMCYKKSRKYGYRG